MSNQNKSYNMVAKNKNLLLCSTPEYRPESPSHDSDSICDSDSASPVPFQCTQDGAEGETDVVWNFYTPKSERRSKTHKDTTPLRRKAKRSLRSNIIEKEFPKRRVIKTTQKNTQLLQDLVELNQNVHELIAKKPHNNTEKPPSSSDDDAISASLEYSPKTPKRLNYNCLRKNVLSANVNKQDSENAIESDDSMNECLFKASQIVEDIILNNDDIRSSKLPKKRNSRGNIKDSKNLYCETNHDLVNCVLSKKLESPTISKLKKNSISFNDDSFDCLLGNLNDSTLEQLTQMPMKITVTKTSAEGCMQDLVSDGSPLSKSFGRHNSMPESPSLTDINKPSLSGMVFSRYNSMPYKNDCRTAPSDSPIKCTPDEIKKKHQQAKEKLLAKRVLPFTASQRSQSISPPQPTQSTSKAMFEVKTSKNFTNLKELVEKKRQKALMKLRRRQQQNVS